MVTEPIKKKKLAKKHENLGVTFMERAGSHSERREVEKSGGAMCRCERSLKMTKEQLWYSTDRESHFQSGSRKKWRGEGREQPDFNSKHHDTEKK